MDKQTLSEYGWIIICVLVLAVMLALATPFGGYIKEGTKSTLSGLFMSNEKAFNVVGITAGYTNFDDDVFKDAIYIQGDKKYTYKDTLPTIKSGDIYICGDYEYHYKQYWTENGWVDSTTQKGWAVRVLDNTKETYGQVISNINGQSVVALRRTYANCTNLVVAPIVPNSIMEMFYTYADCENLSIAPQIPNSVTSLYGTFQSCTSLTKTPYIPESVTYMRAAFERCSSLIKITNLPSKVENMHNAFNHCTKLKEVPMLPDSIKNMQATFYNCRELEEIKNLPSKVENMQSAFGYCLKLKNIPSVPSTVTNMNGTFMVCQSLPDTIIVDANPTEYTDTFKATYVKNIVQSDGTIHPNEYALLHTITQN